MTLAAGTTLHFGVLLFPNFQWLDAAGPVDYINSHSQESIEPLRVPQNILDKCPIIKWHYISHDLNPVFPTSGSTLVPTCTYNTAPHLDYIVVPGPDLKATLPPGCSEFLKNRFPQIKALLTVCTGSLAIAPTGILDGLNVCSNKVALKIMVEENLLNRNVKWVGDRRWIRDGKVWSCGGITAGIDLAAEFARVHFDPCIVEMVKAVSEYSPKPDQPDEWAKLLEGVDLDGRN